MLFENGYPTTKLHKKNYQKPFQIDDKVASKVS